MIEMSKWMFTILNWLAGFGILFLVSAYLMLNGKIVFG
jgi:hypothetical protein